ncbi:MAG TPA: hypothetical protein PLZ76_07225, partial [Bacillota bacterium]|nr:hypothetical protein [Bacillota bacterium]
MKRIMVILMLMTMILVVAACDLNGTTTTTASTSSTTTTSTRSITTTSTPSTTSSRKTWWTLPKTTTTTTLLTTTMPSFPDTIEGQMAERLYLINREWEFFSVRYVRIEGTIRVYDEQDNLNQSMEYVLSIRLNYTQHRLIATLI